MKLLCKNYTVNISLNFIRSSSRIQPTVKSCNLITIEDYHLVTIKDYNLFTIEVYHIVTVEDYNLIIVKVYLYYLIIL
jgi:hypothetical protein